MRSVTAEAGPASVKTERLWLASLVRSSRWTSGDAADGVGEPFHDVEAPTLGDVRDGFDEPVGEVGHRP